MSSIKLKKTDNTLLDSKLSSLNTYQGYCKERIRKNGYINKKLIKKFEISRVNNFDKYKPLLNEALSSMPFSKQKELALKYQIGYMEQANSLCMPILDDYGNVISLWKYNNDKETKGRKKTIFPISNLKEYGKSKSTTVYLCSSEKDTLNMLGNGFKAISLSFNVTIPKEYLILFEDLKIVIAYAYDKISFYETKDLIKQLKDIAYSIKVWNWNHIATKYNLKLDKGFSMSDFLTERYINKKKNKSLSLEYNPKEIEKDNSISNDIIELKTKNKDNIYLDI